MIPIFLMMLGFLLIGLSVPGGLVLVFLGAVGFVVGLFRPMLKSGDSAPKQPDMSLRP